MEAEPNQGEGECFSARTRYPPGGGGRVVAFEDREGR